MSHQLTEALDRSDLPGCNGIWMSYTNTHKHPYCIPVRISVGKPSDSVSDITGAAVGFGSFAQHVGPTVLFSPSVYQDHALLGLARIQKLIVQSEWEGQQGMAVWGEERGVRINASTVKFEALDDPYNAYLEEFGHPLPVEDAQIMVPLERGWTKNGLRRELGSIQKDIKEHGLCVGFKYTHDRMFYFISKGLSVKATSDY